MENCVIEPVSTSWTPSSSPIRAAVEELTAPLAPRSCSASRASSCVRSMMENAPVRKSCVTSSSAAALPRLSPQYDHVLLLSKFITAIRTFPSDCAIARTGPSTHTPRVRISATLSIRRRVGMVTLQGCRPAVNVRLHSTDTAPHKPSAGRLAQPDQILPIFSLAAPCSGYLLGRSWRNQGRSRRTAMITIGAGARHP